VALGWRVAGPGETQLGSPRYLCPSLQNDDGAPGSQPRSKGVAPAAVVTALAPDWRAKTHCSCCCSSSSSSSSNHRRRRRRRSVSVQSKLCLSQACFECEAA
jgi:hypothetical protein